MLKIRRSKPVDNFTIIPNAALRDERLTFCARGVLAELLSHSEKWETNADAMSERARKLRGDVVGEGRRGLRSAFAELEAAGYIIRRKEQAAKGRFVTVLEVYDVPQHRGTARGTSAGGMSVSVTSVTGTSSVSTDLRSTEEEDAGEEHSSALAAARAGQQASANDDLRPDLQRWYDAADKLSEERIRRHLLEFEIKRPQVYSDCRKKALDQHKGRDGGKEELHGPDGPRMQDMLVFKYALLHYSKKAIPPWLVKLPR